MPPVRPTHVVSFSSEDPNNPASNLLKGETFRKWKCKEPGEVTAYVILQLEKAVTITSIDIGNEHSALVEVLVGRSGQSPQNFEVLLSQSSFMTPKDARESNNPNRVRMFGPDKLDKTIASQKWDLVKVVCVQSFNTHVQFGLSFININAAADPNDKPKIGGFSLRPALGATEEDSDSGLVGGLFAKRLQTKVGTSSPSSTSSPTTPAAAIRQASASIAGVAIASSEERVKELKKHKLGPDDDNSDVKFGKSKPKSRSPSPSSRKSAWYGSPSSPSSSSNGSSRNPKTVQTPTSSKATPSSSKVSSAPNGPVRNAGSGSIVKKLATKKNSRKTKPFSKLFEGVVFVLSGFVNPERSTLRSKACQMGARCKNDWDRTCTHLICAFVNTPKFREVRQSGHGKIVKKEWIESSYNCKRRFPWRRYCLDRNDQGSDSEEEIFDEADIMDEDEEILPGSASTRDSEDEEDKGLSSKFISTPKRDAASKSSEEDEIENDEAEVRKPKSPKRRRILEIESSDEENETNGTAMKAEASQENVHKINAEDDPASDSYLADTDVEDRDDDDGGSSPSMLANYQEITNDFFEGKVFYFHGSDQGLKDDHKVIEEIIRHYKGEIETHHTARVEYVLTDAVQWEEEFSEAMAENPNLTFVQTKWIVECEKKNELVSPDPFMILPN